MQLSTLNFNKELAFGECGALVVANATALIVSHLTRKPAVISASAVGGTLVGGALFWLAARIYDKVATKDFSVDEMSSDIRYFTPAAIIFGLIGYDPSLYFVSCYLLARDWRVGTSVVTAQTIAFALFLACMNGYRVVLLRVRGKQL
jgi:hypothetical protein